MEPSRMQSGLVVGQRHAGVALQSVWPFTQVAWERGCSCTVTLPTLWVVTLPPSASRSDRAEESSVGTSSTSCRGGVEAQLL